MKNRLKSRRKGKYLRTNRVYLQKRSLELYKSLNEKYSLDIIASGGVSTISDISALKAMNMYGAIIGKAYYTGAIDLKEAIEVAK